VVDCTGDGLICHYAGCEWKQGDNEGHKYAMALTKVVRLGGIGPDAGVADQHEWNAMKASLEAAVSRGDLDAGAMFGQARSVTEELEIAASIGAKYDLVGEVAQAAAITRRSAALILAGIDERVFGQFRHNPEEFIRKAGRLIVEEKATMVVEHVTYHPTDQVHDATIFTERMPEAASRAYKARKNVQDFVFPDSQVERKFAEDLDAAEEVVVYAKLPRAFQIPTPVGEYAPDWAIAFRRGSVKHVFFVAETKGSMSTLDLSGVEATKIACAKKLFNEISTSEVRYHNVATYGDLLMVMGGME